MIIDCISDLHGEFPSLPGGDLLIIAGDISGRGNFTEWQAFANWIGRQEYEKKIYIAGNHDNFLYESRLLIQPLVGPYNVAAAEFLCDSGTEYGGLKIWGSPWTTKFKGINPECCAFTVDTEEEIAVKWAMIPDDTDILVTHSPAHGVLDDVTRRTKDGMQTFSCGSRYLLDALRNVKPRLHVFGHIHGHGGQRVHLQYSYYDADIDAYLPEPQYTICVNASHMNEVYDPVNPPVRVEL